MKFGIYAPYWTHEWTSDYEYYIPKVKKLGFDALEISCAALMEKYTTDAQLLELKKRAEDNGITLTAGYGPTKNDNICSTDPAIVSRAMDFFQKLLPRLQKMDIHILGGGLYTYWPLDPAMPMDKEGDLERSIKNMRILGKTAEDCGVVLGMEVLNRFEGYMINTCEECKRYIDAVGSPNVKIMLDTFHMNIEERSMGGAILASQGRIGHVHFVENTRGMPGLGCQNFGEILGCLRRAGYGGFLGFEAISPGDPEKEAKNAISYVRALLNGLN